MEGLQKESQLEFKSITERRLFEVLTGEYLFSEQDIVTMILGIEGIKPVSEVTMAKYNLEDVETKITNIRTLLTESGLFLTEKEREHEHFGALHDFNFSKDEALLAKHVQYVSDQPEIPEDTPASHDAEYYETVGKELGYPATAVYGFIHDERMETKDLPKDVLNSETGKLFNRVSLFILSRDHWQEELKFFEEKWMSPIKEKYPLIYKYMIISCYDGEEIVKRIPFVQEWDGEKRKKFMEKLLAMPMEELNFESMIVEAEKFN